MEKKSKKSIIIGITSLTLVTLLLLGLTYAYYRTRIVGNPNSESIYVVTKKLGISYVDNQAVITAKGIEPGYNNEANPKTFTVHNTGDEAGTFNIILDNVENEFTKGTATRGEYNDWTYELYEGTTISSDTLLKSGEITSEEKQLLINNVFIDSQNEITYTLIIRYAELTNVDQSDDMGSNLSIRVNIEEGSISGNNTQENPLFASQPGTLLYALNANKPSGSETTVPGQEPSTSNEARMVETEDDYGTSYVYRGNVENNYITYSNMCWRIVRIQGDGSIKLALADGAHPCGTDTGYSVTNTDSAFIADESENVKGVAYKTNLSHDATDFPFANSDIPPELTIWAENNSLDMSQLVEAEWCNDTSVASQEDYTADYGPIVNYYGAYGRLFQVDSAEPTLKCNINGLDNTKSTKYKNVLGILSADELAFAGSTEWYSGGTWDYYLKTNANGVNSYWTMSPYNGATENDSLVLMVFSSGDMGIDGPADNNSVAVRPAVVLKSSVLATTDSASEYAAGTYQNPYKVN